VNTVVVYTTIFDNYDLLIPTKTNDIRHVCFTDRNVSSSGWEVKVVDRMFYSPQRESRLYKTLPHLWFPDYDISIYHDGCMGLKVHPKELIAYLGDNDVVLFQHPQHAGTRDEATALVEVGKAHAGVVDRQLSAYRSEGMPGDTGLYACKAIIRRHTEQVRQLNELWWAEQMRFGPRDQIAFAYARWKMGIQCSLFPGKFYPGIADDLFYKNDHLKRCYED